MGKSIKKFFSMLLVTTFLLSSTSSVFASQNNISDKNPIIKQSESTSKDTLTKTEKKELINWMTANGIDKNTQKNLLNKLAKGILWDSLTDSTPVKTINLTKDSIKYIFADGSIAISTMDFSSATTNVPEDSLSVAAYASSYTLHIYTNVKIAYTIGVVTASFVADYTLIDGSYDRIDNVRNPQIICLGMSHSGTVLAINQKYEGSYYNAQASLSFNVSLAGIFSTNYTLYLYVGGNRAYKEFR